jgi:bacterioferritin (cytochrome b1)
MARFSGVSAMAVRPIGRLMEDILASEEEHADDLKTLLETIEQEGKQRERQGA